MFCAAGHPPVRSALSTESFETAVFQNLWRRTAHAVLIVSETPSDPLFNSAFLRQPEIRLLTTCPDEEGLRIARRERPNLIIEDLQPTDRLGLGFCRRLRTDPATRAIPLILVAAPEMVSQAREAHADALLDKPLTRRELFQAVQRFLPLPRRRTQRLYINLRFTFRTGERLGQAFSRDLSQGGAFLKTDRILALGSRLELGFSLPGIWEEIRCHAVVRSSTFAEPSSGHLSGVGVEFEDLTDEQAEMLDAFIERHLRRPLLSR
jgi:uncharacterized protein (TIGR02266 family)